MSKSPDRDDPRAVQSDPVGIVVRERPRALSLPRAVAFVWGGEIGQGPPSLPFGRWKAA